MRISRPINLTFKSHLQNVYYVDDMIDEMEVMQLLSKFEQLGSAMNYTTPILFSIDYTKSRYVVMTNSTRMVIGQDAREFLEGGMPYLIDIFQKDDFKIYNEHVFVENTKFLKNQPQEDHNKFIFSYNFRARHKTGKYVPILQRGCYVTSKETGLPLYSLGMVVDITHFKKDRLIYHTIEKTEKINEHAQKNRHQKRSRTYCICMQERTGMMPPFNHQKRITITLHEDTVLSQRAGLKFKSRKKLTDRQI